MAATNPHYMGPPDPSVRHYCLCVVRFSPAITATIVYISIDTDQTRRGEKSACLGPAEAETGSLISLLRLLLGDTRRFVRLWF